GLPIARPLRRGSARSRQLGASRETRRDPSSLAFRARTGAAVPDRVVLVDDVHTTGATLQACAGVLRDAGSSTVSAITWARALDDRSR
ncbi:MAG: hypothetical protein Q8O56_08480, partial [Solirubrobacteraceae bacterium]|nr:hypothetical protein [Solirubrobacteraceae bacterium]